jgi:hypothetical protein
VQAVPSKYSWRLFLRTTHLYARFLPNGKLTAELARASSATAPTILLLEQTPYTLGAYEIGYQGPDRIVLLTRLERSLDPSHTFVGSPRP